MWPSRDLIERFAELFYNCTERFLLACFKRLCDERLLAHPAGAEFQPSGDERCSSRWPLWVSRIDLF